MAVINNFEIYANRKEEIVARVFGVIDPGHPYISHIYSGGDWLIGGEIQLLDRIRYIHTDGDMMYTCQCTSMLCLEVCGGLCASLFQHRHVRQCANGKLPTQIVPYGERLPATSI